jgi:hypothetical protein
LESHPLNRAAAHDHPRAGRKPQQLGDEEIAAVARRKPGPACPIRGQTDRQCSSNVQPLSDLHLTSPGQVGNEPLEAARLPRAGAFKGALREAARHGRQGDRLRAQRARVEARARHEVLNVSLIRGVDPRSSSRHAMARTARFCGVAATALHYPTGI